MPIDEQEFMRAARRVVKPGMRSIMEEVKASMGPEGNGIVIPDPAGDDDDSLGSLGFPSQEIADKFMAKLKERLGNR